jgi:hypothetical protein
MLKELKKESGERRDYATKCPNTVDWYTSSPYRRNHGSPQFEYRSRKDEPKLGLELEQSAREILAHVKGDTGFPTLSGPKLTGGCPRGNTSSLTRRYGRKLSDSPIQYVLATLFY